MGLQHSFGSCLIWEKGYLKVLDSKYLTKKEVLNRIYSKCQG